VPPQLWVQGASVRWRPDFRFYEARTRFLSRLDEKGLIRAWRVEEEEVSARLRDADHEALLDSGGITVIGTTLEPDIERLIFAAEAAIKEVGIPRLTTMRVQFEYIYPLEGSYDEIRIESARRFLGSLADLRITDYAVLLDGQRSDLSYEYKLEFGIVSRTEIPLRLSRLIGRMRGEGEQQSLPRSLNFSKLPEVALFADMSWRYAQAPVASEAGGALRELWTNGRREADALLEQIKSTATDKS
jgi:hypothetical protein